MAAVVVEVAATVVYDDDHKGSVQTPVDMLVDTIDKIKLTVVLVLAVVLTHRTAACPIVIVMTFIPSTMSKIDVVVVAHSAARSGREQIGAD